MVLNRSIGFLMLGIGLIIVGLFGLLGAALPPALIFIWMIITGVLICFGR